MAKVKAVKTVSTYKVTLSQAEMDIVSCALAVLVDGHLKEGAGVVDLDAVTTLYRSVENYDSEPFTYGHVIKGL